MNMQYLSCLHALVRASLCPSSPSLPRSCMHPALCCHSMHKKGSPSVFCTMQLAKHGYDHILLRYFTDITCIPFAECMKTSSCNMYWKSYGYTKSLTRRPSKQTSADRACLSAHGMRQMYLCKARIGFVMLVNASCLLSFIQVLMSSADHLMSRACMRVPQDATARMIAFRSPECLMSVRA